MRPEFGCAVHDYVFAPADASTAGDIAYAVRVALDRWEPRIELEEVVVRFDAVDQGMLYIDIQYSVRGTNDPRNLVFPFYVIPRDEEVASWACPSRTSTTDGSRTSSTTPSAWCSSAAPSGPTTTCPTPA